MNVFGLTGLPGSGKSEVGRVGSDLGHPVVRMGDMVWEHVRSLGLELESGIVGRIAHQRRQEEGSDIWARVTADHIRKLVNENPPTIVLIDGIRSHDEVDRFQHEFEDFSIIAVHTSPQTRYERIMARKRVDDTLSYEAFLERENRELGWGIAQVIAQADIMIVNEGSLEDLDKQITTLLSR
jgi:dephospho-CoA kinase